MTTDIDPTLTGAAFDLANAGYTPMKGPDEKSDQEEIGSDNASLRQAAERSTVASDPVMVREYLDADGEPAPSSEAVTLERAARDHAGVTSAARRCQDAQQQAFGFRQLQGCGCAVSDAEIR
jgi:hypothetical protein